MSQAPSEICFVCEACQKPATARHVRRWSGLCRHCQGQSWSLIVSYTHAEAEPSAAGLLASATIGVGFSKVTTTTNQTVVDGVSSKIAHALTEKRSQVAVRVVQYLRLRDQQNMRDRGAISCQMCDALYIPTDEKTWSRQGFCSKSCAAKGDADPVFETTEKPARVPMISVVCPNGHQFEVFASFSGCIRPCPDCRAKTHVP
jgi:hypothetical protein